MLLFKNWNTRRAFSLLPDIWFLVILLLGWFDFVRGAFIGTLHTVNIILGVCLLLFTTALVIQIFKRKAVVSFIMGFIFLVISFYMLLALFSELKEFPELTAPGAIAMMLGGAIIIGGSLVMSLLMLLRNTFRGTSNTQQEVS